MGTRTGRLATLAAGVLLLAGLAGCDLDPPSAAPTAAHTRPARAAAASTPPAAPAPTPTRTAGVIDLTAADFATVVSKAQADLTLQACHFTLTVDAAGQEQMSSAGVLRVAADGQVEMVERATVAGQGSVEMRLVEGVLYVSTDGPDGTFVALDPHDPSLTFSVPTDVDPAGNAADLSPAILSVTEVGAPVLVGGVPTQEYDVVVDLAKVTGPSGERLRAAAQQAAALGQHLPPMVTYHYWLAADGLEMRISYEMLGATWAMTFSQWGEPVDIQAPGADRMSNLDQD